PIYSALECYKNSPKPQSTKPSKLGHIFIRKPTNPGKKLGQTIGKYIFGLPKKGSYQPMGCDRRSICKTEGCTTSKMRNGKNRTLCCCKGELCNPGA
ncbi:hypothetical protein PMAYCL1PPCAC_04622, partial [Pristionchus mayeri]